MSLPSLLDRCEFEIPPWSLKPTQLVGPWQHIENSIPPVESSTHLGQTLAKAGPLLRVLVFETRQLRPLNITLSLKNMYKTSWKKITQSFKFNWDPPPPPPPPQKKKVTRKWNELRLSGTSATLKSGQGQWNQSERVKFKFQFRLLSCKPERPSSLWCRYDLKTRLGTTKLIERVHSGVLPSHPV